MDLSGSVAFVTGGSGGLGRQICKSLANNGVTVAVGYLNGSDRADDVCREVSAEGGKAIPIQIDQSEETSIGLAIESVVENLGSLDILINNAAMAKGVPFPDLEALSPQLWDTTMQVNLRGPWLVSRAAADQLKNLTGVESSMLLLWRA